MKKLAPLSSLLLSVMLVQAAPPQLEIPPEVRPTGQYVSLTPKTTAKSVVYIGLDGVDSVPSDLLKDGRVFLLDTRGMAVGRYRFAAVGGLNGDQTRVDFVVVIGNPTPTPIPPGPIPPTPVPPVPVPTPAPIQADGLHVLILVESADLPKMSSEQQSILFSKTSRDYLNSHCAPDPQTDSKKAWWMLDKDTDLSMLAKKWQDAKARPRASVPWMIVSNPQKGGGWEGPLPATLAEAMTIFKKYGGE